MKKCGDCGWSRKAWNEEYVSCIFSKYVNVPVGGTCHKWKPKP